jgi:hypothetical protein
MRLHTNRFQHTCRYRPPVSGMTSSFSSPVASLQVRRSSISHTSSPGVAVGVAGNGAGLWAWCRGWACSSPGGAGWYEVRATVLHYLHGTSSRFMWSHMRVAWGGCSPKWEPGRGGQVQTQHVLHMACCFSGCRCAGSNSVVQQQRQQAPNQ